MITEDNELRAAGLSELDFSTATTAPLIQAGKCDAIYGLMSLNDTAVSDDMQQKYDDCKVQMEQYIIESRMTWLTEHTWAIGLILLFFGFIIALCGKRCFPYVSAIIGAIIVIPVSILLCAG